MTCSRRRALAGMIIGHMVADGPLQPRGLSIAKGRYWSAKVFHGAVHGTSVGLATGSVALGLAETITHVAIDHAKRSGLLTTQQDQTFHVLCKFAWCLAMATSKRCES